MKVFRERHRLASGKLLSFTYIRANWFEARALRARIKAGRPNLHEMPAKWPAAKRYRAQFALNRHAAVRAADRPNPGRIVTAVRWLLKPEFNWLDMIGVTVTGVILLAGYPVTSAVLGTIMAAGSTYLRHKLRFVQ